jgi:hypothetical protein
LTDQQAGHAPDTSIKQPQPNWIVRRVQKIKRYLHERRAAKKQENSQDRSSRRTATATVWIAILTVAVLIVGGLQYITFDRQLSVMQSQLNEMQEESRPWIGVDLVQNDNVVESGKPFKIIVHIKNFGHSPSPKVRGCVGSDTPNIHQQDRAGLAKMMEQLSACKDAAETVLMPSGEFSFNARA